LDEQGVITWGPFNQDGHPEAATQKRFRNSCGFDPAPPLRAAVPSELPLAILRLEQFAPVSRARPYFIINGNDTEQLGIGDLSADSTD
jgi:hypothetical protein